MPDTKIDITEINCPPVVREWLDSLGWNEVDHMHINRNILRDGFEVDAKGQRWARWKHDRDVVITVYRNGEPRMQKFLVEDGAWKTLLEAQETEKGQ